jgi:hypothetical protein
MITFESIWPAGYFPDTWFAQIPLLSESAGQVFWPQAALYWPWRAMPQAFMPDDARRYEVYKRTALDGADTLIATLIAGSGAYLVTGASGGVAWYWARAFTRRGIPDAESIRSKLTRVAFDSLGALVLPAPNAPTGLSIVRGSGGLMTAQWGYSRNNEPAAVDHFDVFVATGATAMNYTAADYQVTASGGQRYQRSLGTFANGTTVRCVVRSVAASAASETNTTEASAVADALGPDAVAAMTVEVTS